MENLILYSNGCPKCRVLKNKLEAKNIEFVESGNVEELIPLGIKSLPALKFGDKMMNFMAANDWVNKQGDR
jgi:hypothetical protein